MSSCLTLKDYPAVLGGGGGGGEHWLLGPGTGEQEEKGGAPAWKGSSLNRPKRGGTVGPEEG